MNVYSLENGPPESIASSTSPLYLLGVGGPEDAEGIGKVESFVWRFSVLERRDQAPIAFGFTSMPTLMLFTRSVNSKAPFTVTTEVFKLLPSDLRNGAPANLVIDPDPEGFFALLGSSALVERRIPELEGQR